MFLKIMTALQQIVGFDVYLFIRGGALFLQVFFFWLFIYLFFLQLHWSIANLNKRWHHVS